jgi:hypothetical protein
MVNGQPEYLCGLEVDGHFEPGGQLHGQFGRLYALENAIDNGVWRRGRALRKDTPLGRPVQTTGSIMTIPFLGGLHHQYARMT